MPPPGIVYMKSATSITLGLFVLLGACAAEAAAPSDLDALHSSIDGH
jgi:hypothetical protein